MPDPVVAEALAALDADGPIAFAVDALRLDDLTFIDWSGSPLHVEHVGDALRRPAGEVDYLCLRTPTGAPVAKGGMQHTESHGPGQLWQLAVHPELQCSGLGARLIEGLEDVARGRGLAATWLGVELDNPRARALYERLGYVAFGEEDSGWDAVDADGNHFRYETRLTLMRKPLA